MIAADNNNSSVVRLRVAEILLFVAVGAVVAAPVVLSMFRSSPLGAIGKLARAFAPVLCGALIAIFPFVFLVMSGSTPFEYARRRRAVAAGDIQNVEADRVSQVLTRIPEWFVFALLGLIVSSRNIIAITAFPGDALEILQEFYLDILVSLIIVTFPFLHVLTFGITIRQRIMRVRSKTTRQQENVRHELKKGADADARGSVRTFFAETRGEIIVQTYVTESREIAEGLYTRAGIYLILGVLIAFSGLFFFYSQTANVAGETSAAQQAATASSAAAEKKDAVQSSDAISILTVRLADLLPRFGILFFIEFVAFFFLRQYRSAMDEFRYFEAVKRYREETLAFICFLREAGGAVDPTTLLETKLLFSTTVGTQPPAATGFLETGSLSKEEVSLLEKVVSAIAARKAG